MNIKELMLQDPREFFGESDPREIEKILNDDARQLAEVYSDDSIPYSYE